MKPYLTFACCLAAAAIMGYALGTENAPKPAPSDAATITSLEYDIQSLRDEVRMKANEIEELKSRPPQVVEKVVTETIRVRDDAEVKRLTAELEAARQRGACQQPVEIYEYQPRFRLFRGRR